MQEDPAWNGPVVKSSLPVVASYDTHKGRHWLYSNPQATLGNDVIVLFDNI